MYPVPESASAVGLNRIICTRRGGVTYPDPDPIGRDIARIRFTGVLQICTLSQAIIAEWAIKDPDRWTK